MERFTISLDDNVPRGFDRKIAHSGAVHLHPKPRS